MKVWASVLAAAVGLSTAVPAAAQLPERGEWSLQLSSSGSSQAGAWRMVSARANLGVDVGVALSRSGLDDSDGPTRWGLTVAPSVKRYAAPVGRVAPYLFGSVPLGVQREEIGPDIQARSWTVGAALAGGLDWFPVRGVSLGGHAGFRAVHGAARGASSSVPEVESSRLVLGTFASGLSLHIYF